MKSKLVIPMSDPTLTGVPAEAEIGKSTALFTTQAIDADVPVDISVSFPSGSLVTRPQAWQSAQITRQI